MIRGRTDHEVKIYDWIKGGVGLLIFGSLLGLGASIPPPVKIDVSLFGLDPVRNVSPVGKPLEAIYGRGTPGSVLTIRVDGADYGRVTVDESGRWKVNRPLLAGSYQVEIVKLDLRDDPIATLGPYPLVAGVGGTPPPEVEPEPERTVATAVVEPATERRIVPESLGGLEPEIRRAETQKRDTQGGAERTVRDRVTIDQKAPGARIPDGLLLLSGEAPTGVRVEIYADGKLLGRARGDAQGTWRSRVSVLPNTRQIAVRASKSEVRGTVWQAPESR